MKVDSCNGLNATQYQVPVGVVPGLVYLVPNQLDHGYTEMYGEVSWATAISFQLGLNATQSQV